jgi:hypothetical protein
VLSIHILFLLPENFPDTSLTSNFNPTIMSVAASNDTYIICTLDTCPITDAYVEYIPSLAGNATYLSIFAILWCAQMYQGIRYRTWGFLTGMAVGGLLEIAGYLGRILLHSDPFNFNYFLV